MIYILIRYRSFDKEISWKEITNNFLFTKSDSSINNVKLSILVNSYLFYNENLKIHC